MRLGAHMVRIGAHGGLTRLGAVFVALLALVACKDPPASLDAATAPAGAPPKTLTIAAAPLSSLDPAFANGPAGLMASQACSAGLLVPTADGAAPVMDLAGEMTTSSDGLTYTFVLAEGATFSDGSAVTAAHVVASWTRLLDPATGSPHAHLLWVVQGAEDYTKGTGTKEAVGITAEDPRTVLVTLRGPTPSFPWIVASAPLGIVHDAVTSSATSSPTSWPCAGPFVIASWKPKVELVLTKNPSYVAHDDVALDEVRLVFASSPEAALAMYAKGSVDMIRGGLPLSFLKKPPPALEDELVEAKVLCTVYVGFDHGDAILGNQAVREAIVDTIDTQALVTHVLWPGLTPACGILPPASTMPESYGDLGFPLEEPSCAPSPSEALALLSKAGHPKGAGIPPLELLHVAHPGYSLVASRLAEAVAPLGITLQPVAVEWSEFEARRAAKSFDLYLGTWCADFPAPESMLQPWTTGHSANAGGFSSSAFDQLVASLGATTSPVERSALAKKAAHLLGSQAALVPLYHVTKASLVKPYVGGVVGNPLDVTPLRWMTVP